MSLDALFILGPGECSATLKRGASAHGPHAHARACASDSARMSFTWGQEHALRCTFIPNALTAPWCHLFHNPQYRTATVVPSTRVPPFTQRIPATFRMLPVILALLLPTLLFAQDPAPGGESDTSRSSLDRRVRVFLDCDQCFNSYMRRNLTFVDYVRDRKQADVQVLGTRRPSGGGGASYRLEFIGRGDLKNERYELTYNARSTLTREELRRRLADRLRLGLVPFANRTPEADYLEVTYNPPDEDDAPAPDEDPWDQWVFDVGTSASGNLQDREYSYEIEGDLNAERVTEAWKIDFRLDGEQEVDVFEREDTTDIRSTSESYDFDGEVIKTLGPNSGSGLSGSVFSRTFNNIQVAARLRAAAEYNLFPYAISDQKQLTFTYRIGPEYRNYREVTIFDKRRETLFQQAAAVRLRLNQTWGSVFAGLEWANFFHDLSKNSLEFRSFLDVQLVEGLSLRLSLNAERIQDQLSLPAGDLSEEEVLLRRQERATNYELEGSIGLSYTFGSIFNNVVNTRL